MFAMVFVIAFIGSAFVAWILMLVIGAAHSVEPAIPALGFWPCFLVVFIISLFRSSSNVNVQR